MKRTLRTTIAGVLASLLLMAATHAHDYEVGDLSIGHPWIRATLKGAQNASGYMKITNNGSEVDRLVGGSVAGAKLFEVHHMRVENNVMKMRRVEDGLEIKPGETVELKPGSLHLMIMGLDGGYEEGSKVPGTLTFEKAGSIEVEFAVQSRAEEDDHAGSGHNGH